MDRPLPSQSTALIPVALLGLLGLPLIIYAGHDSRLSFEAYALGLIGTLLIALWTTLKTAGLNRSLTITAACLLAALCIMQITIFDSSKNRENSKTKPANEKHVGHS